MRIENRAFEIPRSASSRDCSVLEDVPLIHVDGDQASYWCWAACATMVIHKYGDTSVDQCCVAARKLKLDCCISQRPMCALGCDPGEVAGVYAQWNIHCSPPLCAVGYEMLANEFCQGRPVEVGIKWYSPDNKGHLIIVRGCQLLFVFPHFYIQLLHINDPNPEQNKGIATYGEVLRGYFGKGWWQHTWLDIYPESNP